MDEIALMSLPFFVKRLKERFACCQSEAIATSTEETRITRARFAFGVPGPIERAIELLTTLGSI